HDPPLYHGCPASGQAGPAHLRAYRQSDGCEDLDRRADPRLVSAVQRQGLVHFLKTCCEEPLLGAPRSSVASGAGLEPGAPRIMPKHSCGDVLGIAIGGWGVKRLRANPPALSPRYGERRWRQWPPYLLRSCASPAPRGPPT